MGIKLTERIKYWSQLFLLPVYGFSFLVPRNKKIWVFGSTFGRRFAENPRYLYLYCTQNEKNNIRPVWISHRKEIVDFLNGRGYEAYTYHSLKGIYYSLRAGVYIFDNYSKDIDFWLSGGAVKINLWHGSGNKRTNHDNEFDKVRHPRTPWEHWCTWLRRLSDEKPYHYTLATSEAMAKIFTSAFATDLGHIIIEGYPRNDALFSEKESNIINLCTELEQALLLHLMSLKIQGQKIAAYMPTFRDSEKVFFDVMDLEKFNEFLQREQLTLVTKLHPKSKLKQEFEAIHYSNIVNADAEIDVYSFLKEVDVLITDYSSVYTDFMLLNRPVIAFHYDWELYTANTRDSYIDHDIYMPEYKAKTMEELMNGLHDVLQEDSHREQRLQSRKRMFQSVDGKSSQRLFHKLWEIAGCMR
ncbi:MAG: CDP-glycerol glycerophosphotransferase family protein [Lachnospiraceae bacterium]|nr:CDP-glycerol glycerophosphotransferase family protein [Lachnospiraceae bacterium]